MHVNKQVVNEEFVYLCIKWTDKILSVSETPSSVADSTDDVILDSEDERSNKVKRKVCSGIYNVITRKWNFVMSINKSLPQ